MTRAIIVGALLLGAATGSLLVAGTASAKELAPTSIGADKPTVDFDAGPPSFRTVLRTVDFGVDVVFSRLTFWNSACNARDVTVTVTRPPANGTISVTEGLNTATKSKIWHCRTLRRHANHGQADGISVQTWFPWQRRRGLRIYFGSGREISGNCYHHSAMISSKPICLFMVKADVDADMPKPT